MSTTGSSPGATLRAVIYAPSRLDELSTARVIEQVADAVHKQQKGGQALGSLTPDAIFVGADAIELRSGPPKSDYAAPETAGGKPGDRRSDVFSLGAILWEALAHERRTAGAFRAPSELNANVPPELDGICKKALSHDPAERFPSTKVMAAELSTILDDAGYPDDLSRIAEYLKSSFTAVSTGASLAAKLAAAPATSTPAPAPRAALNQTMMGVAPAVVAEAASTSPVSPLSFVSKTGTMPPPTVLVVPATPVTASTTDTPLAAPPGPPTETAPGGWVSGAKNESADPDLLTTPFTKTETPEPATKLAGVPLEPTKLTAAEQKVPAAIASAETVATPALVPTVDPPAPASGILGLPSLPPGAESATVAGARAAAVAIADQPTAPIVAKTRAKTSSGAPDPAAAVSLPFRSRRDSQGDMLESWASTGDALEIDDGHESDIIEEQRKQRKRLLVISGGALAAILLVAIIALTFGESDKPVPKVEEAAINAPSPTAADPSPSVQAATDPQPAAPVETEPTAGSGSADQGSGSGSGSAEQAIATTGSADDAAAREAAEKAEADRLAAEKAEAERVAKETADKKALDDKAALDAKAEEQRVAKEAADLKAADDKAAQAEKARLANEEAAAKKSAAQKSAAEKTRLANEEAAAKKRAADKAAADKKAQAAADKKAQAAAQAKAQAKNDAKKDPKKAQPKQVASTPVDPYAEQKRGDSAALYKQGFQQYVRGDSAGALLTFTDARQANPNYPPTYRGLGLVYEKMGQKEKAKISFKKYLQLSPEAGDADQIRERMTRL